jgi:hypothetical protein
VGMHLYINNIWNQHKNKKKRKREKETKEKKQKTTKEIPRKTSSYCKLQDWKISI